MAEPARNLYESDDEQPQTRPNLHVVAGGGETTPGRGNLRSIQGDGGSGEGNAAGSGRSGLRSISGGGESTPGRGNLRSVASPDELKKAEAEDPIGGLYKAAGLNPDDAGEGGNKLMRRLKGISRRKKLAGAGGVGGIAGLFIAIAVISPIYRIPALMGDIENRIGEQVNDIVEKRAERMIVNYLIKQAGGSTTDYVITGSPLDDIWRTFQSRRIEKKIFEKTGIRFFKGADGIVHLEHDGRDLGKARKYDELKALIDHGTIDTKDDFKIILRAVLPAVRFHKASVEAKSFKNRFLKGRGFGAPKSEEKHGTPGNKEEQAASKNAAKKAVQDLTTQQIDEGVAGTIDIFDKVVDCLEDDTSTACDPFKQENPDATVPDPNSEAGKRITEGGGRAGENGSASEVEQELRDAKEEAKNEAKDDRQGGFANRLLEKLLTRVVGAATAKTIAKVIPFVGWFDFAADLQHMLGTMLENHLIERIPSMLRENAYGAIFAAWEGYAHQTKAGRMPNSQNDALNEQLGDAGKAQSHHYLYGGTTAGLPINPKVESDKFGTFFDIASAVYNNFFLKYTLRGIFEIWFYTIGKVLKVVGDWGSEGLSWLLRVTGFTDAWEGFLKDMFGENWKEELGAFAVRFILYLFGILIDPLARGAELMNNIFAGAAVALNWHCRFLLGCRQLDTKQAAAAGMYFQQKAREDMAATSLRDRLFSIDLPTSLTGALVRDAPTSNSPSGIMAAVFTQVGRLPSAVMTAFSPNARAATTFVGYSQLAGVQWYGALPADLDQDTAVEVRQQKTGELKCPEVKSSEQFNVCAADSTVIKSLKCVVDPNNCPEFQ